MKEKITSWFSKYDKYERAITKMLLAVLLVIFGTVLIDIWQVDGFSGRFVGATYGLGMIGLILTVALLGPKGGGW